MTSPTDSDCMRETKWIDAVSEDDVDRESVVPFSYCGRTIAIIRSPDGQFYATDGICTHEDAPLADGLVDGDVIECPWHGGQFDYRTGAAVRAPVCIDLMVYEVKIEEGRVFIKVE